MHKPREEEKPSAQNSKIYFFAFFALIVAGLFKYLDSSSSPLLEPDEMTLRLSLLESKKIQTEYEDKLFIYFKDPQAKKERGSYIYDIDNAYEESFKIYDVENNTRLEEAKLLVFVEAHDSQYSRDFLSLFWTQLPTIRDIILVEGRESLAPVNCTHAVIPFRAQHGLVKVAINPYFNCYGWDSLENLNSINLMERMYHQIHPGADFNRFIQEDPQLIQVAVTKRNERLMETINAATQLFKFGLAKIFVLIGSAHIFPPVDHYSFSPKIAEVKPEDPRRPLINFLQNHSFALFSPKSPTHLLERISRPKQANLLNL